MDFDASRVRPSLDVSTASLSNDEQQIGYRRRRTASCAHYVEANKVRFTMETIMEVTALQASPLLHTNRSFYRSNH